MYLVGTGQAVIQGGIVDRSAITRKPYCWESAITSSNPEKSGGRDGSTKASDGATSRRIADTCIRAASANMACMNEYGLLSFSIE